MFGDLPKDAEYDKYIYSRDNVAVFAILKLISNPKKVFIVCNAHLLFNQNRGDIKLGQITQIMKMFNVLNSVYGKYYK
jgi:hypothetical protein